MNLFPFEMINDFGKSCCKKYIAIFFLTIVSYVNYENYNKLSKNQIINIFQIF